MKATDRFDSLFQFYAEKYDLDWKLSKKIMIQESGGRSNAVSPAGAQGLMQFMPATWKEFGRYRDPFNPEDSIEVHCVYLRYLMSKFDNDPVMSLAAYNWGEGRVLRTITRYGTVWKKFLPKETRDYLKGILG